MCVCVGVFFIPPLDAFGGSAYVELEDSTFGNVATGVCYMGVAVGTGDDLIGVVIVGGILSMILRCVTNVRRAL